MVLGFYFLTPSEMSRLFPFWEEVVVLLVHSGGESGPLKKLTSRSQGLLWYSIDHRCEVANPRAKAVTLPNAVPKSWAHFPSLGFPGMRVQASAAQDTGTESLRLGRLGFGYDFRKPRQIRYLKDPKSLVRAWRLGCPW